MMMRMTMTMTMMMMNVENDYGDDNDIAVDL